MNHETEETHLSRNESSSPKHDAATQSDRVRVTMSLPKSAVDTLKRVAEYEGINLTEATRRAILAEEFLSRNIAEGNKILVETPNGTQREVIFR